MNSSPITLESLSEMGAPATVLAISAPNCSHCKAIAPLLADATVRHGASVRYLAVSAPDSPELVADLKVRGTPTVLAFREGKQVARHVGSGSPDDIDAVFQAAIGASTPLGAISTTDRAIRTASGAALVAIGAFTNVWWLAAVGAAFLVGGWYDLATRRRNGPKKTVRPAQVAERVKNGEVVVVDVRSATEVAQGMIPSAVHLDIGDRGFREKVAGLDPSREYLIYCASGSRSARALKIFESCGVDQSAHIAGGIRAWTKAGYSTSKAGVK